MRKKIRSRSVSLSVFLVPGAGLPARTTNIVQSGGEPAQLHNSSFLINRLPAAVLKYLSRSIANSLLKKSS